MVLHLSGALAIHYPNAIDSILYADASVVHGLIFHFICDNWIQWDVLDLFIHHFDIHVPHEAEMLFHFLSNPRRSQHHALDHRTHNSITERCFIYILNRQLTHFPGIHHWARKSKCRPWLWRWRKPKGAITNTLSEIRWGQKEQIGCNKKLRPFWALVLALKYLPYLLNKATRSGELIALAKLWPYRYPLLVSLVPHDTKKARKAVKHYLVRVDAKEQCKSIEVGPLPLCVV